MGAELPVFLGALVLGFAGSVHCVAMCGGIAGALGQAMPEKGPLESSARALLYSLGRISSYAIAGALAGELAVARERIDTLERLLQSKSLVSRDEIERYVPDQVAAQERGHWQQEYLARVLRVLQQEVEALQEGESAPSAT